MIVNNDQLFECRNCGPKTADEILTIQSEIDEFVQNQINKQGSFQPEQLIQAPCFNRISSSGYRNYAGEIYIDCNNPVMWLYKWIYGLTRSKKKAKAFMLRKGMLGSHPMTLDATGEQLGGITKERVRQMVIHVEEATKRQQHRLKTLINAAIVIVQNLTSVSEEVASTPANEKIDDRLWSIDCNLLKGTLIKKMATEIKGPTISTLSYQTFFWTLFLKNLKKRIKKHEGPDLFPDIMAAPFW